MSKQLMQVVLPRLARPLYRQLQRYRAGKLSDEQFTEKFDALLQQEHAWLARHGVSALRAALAIHGAVLVLSGPGLRAEAKAANLPLEVIERRAITEAATDVARNFRIKPSGAFRRISRIVAQYGE